MTGPVEFTLTVNGRTYSLRLEPRHTLLDALSSNLCRCTGYQGIVAAVRATLVEIREERGR